MLKYLKNPWIWLGGLLLGIFNVNYFSNALFPWYDELFNYTVGKFYLQNPLAIFKNYLPIYSWYGAEMNHISLYGFQWGYQVFVAVLMNSIGLLGKHLFFAAVAAGIYLLVFLYVKNITKNLKFAVIFVFLIAVISSMVPTRLLFIERPQTMSILFLMVILLLLQKNHWWPSLFVYVLAVNFHMGIYPLLLLPYFIYAIQKKSPLKIIVPAVLTMFTPLGWKTLIIPFIFVSNARIGDKIYEWSSILNFNPPQMELNITLVAFFIWIISLLVFLTVVFRKVDARSALIFKLFLSGLWLLPIMAVRYLGLVLVIVPIFVANDYLMALRDLNRIPHVLPLKEISIAMVLFMTVLVLYIIPFASSADLNTLVNPKKMETAQYINLSGMEVINYIKDHRLERVLNMEMDGVWLTYNGIRPAFTGYDTNFDANDITTAYLTGIYGNDNQKISFLNSSTARYVLIPVDAGTESSTIDGVNEYMTFIRKNPENFRIVFRDSKMGILYEYVP